MKARRIRPTRGINPAFVPRSYHRAKAAGEDYPIPCVIDYPVGSLAEGPGVVVQCCLAEPTMTPADEECHAAVVAFLTHPARKKHFDKLKKLTDPVIFDKLPAGLKNYVETVNSQWKGSQTAAISRGEAEVPALNEPTEEADQAGDTPD